MVTQKSIKEKFEFTYFTDSWITVLLKSSIFPPTNCYHLLIMSKHNPHGFSSDPFICQKTLHITTNQYFPFQISSLPSQFYTTLVSQRWNNLKTTNQKNPKEIKNPTKTRTTTFIHLLPNEAHNQWRHLCEVMSNFISKQPLNFMHWVMFLICLSVCLKYKYKSCFTYTM